MVSGCPSLIQVTLVAGEPVEMQVRLEDVFPGENIKLVILGFAAWESFEISKSYCNTLNNRSRVHLYIHNIAWLALGQMFRTLQNSNTTKFDNVHLLLNPFGYTPMLISFIVPFLRGMRQV